MFFSLTYTALLVAFTYSSSALASPVSTRNRLTIRDVTGPVVPGEYIVKLKKSADRSAHISSLPFAFSVADAFSPLTHMFSEDFFDGYTGTFTTEDLDAILASPDVDYVEPNTIFTIFDQQTNAPWGLQSISTQSSVGRTDSKATDYQYSYTEPAGDEIDVYVVDTGINTEHLEFDGRATFGYATPGMEMRDGHGHGTHCAGTVAGKTYGVAKKANVIAVKVLGDNGQGTSSNIIGGIEWMVQNAKTTGRRSIGSLSLGGGGSSALDAAVKSAIDSGITFVVAAGNSNMDCSGVSPARIPAAITVAASDIKNAKAAFSNFGAPVDIWAPGVDITSAWAGNNTAVNTISGTSMATPHVAGLCAYLWSKDKSMDPAALSEKIKSMGTQGVITGAPDGTVNLLAYNGGGPAESSAPASASSPLPNIANLLGGIGNGLLPTASTSNVPASAPTTGTGGTNPSNQPPATKSSCPPFWPNCPWKHIFS